MWVRLQLDIGWWDIAHGLTRVIQSQNEGELAQAIAERFSPSGLALPVLSVRSGLDLLLGTMQWPVGSEIVYSALNIPDMTMVPAQHGLVPVPADLDLDRLAPNLDLIERAITPRTRAILVAHLYGNFVPLDPIIAIARKHGLMVIEDCAENYDGVYTGHPDADVSLFSFGPLKTATSFAGGVLRVNDPVLFDRLKANHELWPRQSRGDFFNRVVKYSTMKFFGAKWIYGDVRRAIKLAVGDVDKLIHHTAKSFRSDEIMARLRQRPCGPLLASMVRRFATFDHARIAERTKNGRLLTELLRGQVVCPGAEIEPHNYWLYPVMMSDTARAIDALESAGFDATHVQSMCAVVTPADRPELDAVNVREALERMILVPCYPGMPESELRRMATVLIDVERQSSRIEALKVTTKLSDTLVNRLAATPQACVDELNAESVARP